VSVSILLCITGSVASIKAPLVVRELKKKGFSVTCVISESAKKFITPFALELLSETKCYEERDFWQENNIHIQLAKQHDILLVAPATANTIAKCATGVADNLILNCIVAFEGKKVLVPAMHTEMMTNAVVQDALAGCKEQGIVILGPTYGELLSKDRGYGRMIEPKEIAECMDLLSTIDINLTKSLAGQSILITSGGTTEKIDPVRTLSNRSSGKLGSALARCAHIMGAKVTIISTQPIDDIGYTSLVHVVSSAELAEALNNHSSLNESIIMAAAVSDYIPVYQEKKRSRADVTALQVSKNDDILKLITSKTKFKTVIGFCLQDDINDSAIPLQKLTEKCCDFMVANDTTNIAQDQRSYILYNRKSEKHSSIQDVSVNTAAYHILTHTLV
jgi:phosphopantothenoylcysteine decarboxylase/phosphopantothenate--cysteine ligase